MRKDERQEILLSQYHFICKCPACLCDDAWQQRFGAYKCSVCSDILSGKLCVGCGHTESSAYLSMCAEKERELKSDFAKALELLKKDNKEAMKILLKCHRERKLIYYRDHKDIAFGEDALARCYANLGDFSTSADHLYNSVKFASIMYGPESIEYSHELQKLAEVLFNAERFSECLDTSNHAANLFANLYSPGHKALVEINELKLAAETALAPMLPGSSLN